MPVTPLEVSNSSAHTACHSLPSAAGSASLQAATTVITLSCNTTYVHCVSRDICISYSAQAAGNIQTQALPGDVFATSLTTCAAAPMADPSSPCLCLCGGDGEAAAPPRSSSHVRLGDVGGCPCKYSMLNYIYTVLHQYWH